ncbi:MAG: extracellular solute-binding protein [Clostridia bacterium]|nr:extracellular solute-binding protein [Clostridia bacterium]
MNAKKIISGILLAAIAGGLFSGCGSEGQLKTNKTEVLVVTNERSSMNVMQKLVDGFNAENDHITINYECKDDTISDYVMTTYTSKNPPDIHISCGVPMAEEAGWYRELPEDFVKECKEKFVESCFPAPDKNGKIFTFGLNGNGNQRLLYNKDLFKECGLDPENPPKTFDEMREYAKIITEKGNGVKYGFAMPFKDDIFSRYYAMIPGTMSGLMNRDGFEPTTNQFDFTMYAKMIYFLRDLISDGSVFPTPYTLDNDTARAQFAEGNVGMIYGAAWDVGVYNDQFPAKCDWGIAWFPVFDKMTGGYPIGTTSQSKWYMSSMSKHPDEQLEVYKWLVSEEVAKVLLKENAISSSTLKSLQNNFPESDKKGAKEFAEVAYPAFMLDAPKFPSGLKIDGDDQYTTLKNLILDPSLDVEQGLIDLGDKYNKAMKVLDEELKAENDSIEKYHIPDYKFIICSCYNRDKC